MCRISSMGGKPAAAALVARFIKVPYRQRYVRQVLIQTIIDVGKRLGAGSLKKKIVEILINLLGIRGFEKIAAEGLGKMGDTRAVVYLVGRLHLEFRSELLAPVIIKSLGMLGDRRAEYILKILSKQSLSAKIRKAAVKALQQIQGP